MSGVAQLRPRVTAAVVAGKLSAAVTRRLGRGGGTALPGLVASRIAPNIVGALATELSGGLVLVTGTNGKTTTCRILSAVLQGSGRQLIRNASGSNLLRGVASTLVQHVGVSGRIRPRTAIGLFEIDEAALAEVLPQTEPRAVILLDLFRDQLDRYGEVETVARIWRSALAASPPSTLIIANADDPLIAEVAEGSGREVLYFGIESTDAGVAEREHAADVKACPKCGGTIIYDFITYGHLGHYRCTRCSLHRPEPALVARDVRLDGVNGSRFTVVAGDAHETATLPLPGLYNVYNALAALMAGTSLGVELPAAVARLSSVAPAFGRMERFSAKERDVVIALAKNPTGLNEVLRTLAAAGPRLHLLVMLNDNIADGRDVSWIWDADVEMLRGLVQTVVFSGTRAEDMALRFKYAGIFDDEEPPIEHDPARAFTAAVDAVPHGGTLFIVPTYTALLAVREALVDSGYLRPYWEE